MLAAPAPRARCEPEPHRPGISFAHQTERRVLLRSPSQVLLHLITTLLNATPALAQLRTQLEGAMAAATLPEASTSAAAADPAPFQHWTPKLNPPGIVKASVEPMGIDGVMEEEEDADVVDALSAPSPATQKCVSSCALSD